jgi:hypothetical protein
VARKLLIIVIALVVVGLIGFGLYAFLTRPSESTVRGNQFINDVIKNPNEAYNRLGQKLKDWPEDYWKKERFPLFANYQGTPKLIKDEVIPTEGGTEPPAYPPGTDPHRLTYQFTFNNLQYNVIIEIITSNGQWQVNRFDGDYVKP